MDQTFEQAFRMRFETQVDITNAFVPNIGKEKVVEVVEELSEKKFEFKMMECLWAKVFKDLNETEKGYRFSCKPDFAMAKIYHPNVKLTSTKTLM